MNNAAWAKATRPLLDGGKGENSVNIKFQWGSRRRKKRYVSRVECGGETRVQVQARQDTCETVRGAEEIDKASNNCLPDAVVTALENMQAPGKGVNDAVLMASKQMRGSVNKSSLERESLDVVMRSSTEVHTPKKGVSDAGPKA